MDLLTPLDTYCRLIIRAREMEAQIPAQDPDEDPDNVDDLEGGDDDDDNQSLSALQDETNDVEEEIIALLEDLADDQLVEAVALNWVGVGTFDVSEWEDAVAEAEALKPDERVEELMNAPTLAANMESGLAAFDFDCNSVGQLD